MNESELQIISGASITDTDFGESSAVTESIIRVTNDDYNVSVHTFNGMSVGALLLLLSFSVGLFLRMFRNNAS